jgi:hypothetical protein
LKIKYLKVLPFYSHVPTNFKGFAEVIRFNRGLIPWGYNELWVGGLGAELTVGVLHAGSDGVDANVVSGSKEVLVLNVTLAIWVCLSPSAVSGTLGKEIIC